jgi:hypothetical protein
MPEKKRTTSGKLSASIVKGGIIICFVPKVGLSLGGYVSINSRFS